MNQAVQVGEGKGKTTLALGAKIRSAQS